MTWIVGMPATWGYSFAVSDIRVTLADGSELDCLQKIHPVAQSIALGFAGSVRIGFTMLEEMRKWLHIDNPNAAWHPLEVVEILPELARNIFDAAHPDEQSGHSHLLVLSADPQVVNGSWPVTYAHILKSPQFVPEKILTNKVAGIGSGNFIDGYTSYMSELSDNHEKNFSMMQMEAGNPGGMGANLGFRITHLLKSTSPGGISSHLHYCWVYLGRTIIKTNNHVTAGAWTAMDSGSGINQPDSPPSVIDQGGIPGGVLFKMPEIAKSWGEFEQLLDRSGARAQGAVATLAPSAAG